MLFINYMYLKFLLLRHFMFARIPKQLLGEWVSLEQVFYAFIWATGSNYGLSFILKSPKNSPKVLNTVIYEKVNSSLVKYFHLLINSFVEVFRWLKNFVTFHQRIFHRKVAILIQKNQSHFSNMESSRIICGIKLHENLIEVEPKLWGRKCIKSFMAKVPII